MSFKRVFALAIVLLGISWTSAQAGWRIGIGIGWPGYYRPYPYRVYVAPAPVYVAPAPVCVQPVPAYVQPAPVYMQSAPAYAPQSAPTQSPPATERIPAPQPTQGLPPQPVPIGGN
jgi:hypothetical protein